MLYGSDYMKKIYIFIALLLVLCFISFYFFFNREKSFSMVMAGDALITDSILKDAYVKSTNNYQFSKMFKYVYEYIKDYDLRYYNQETPISGNSLGYSGIICYNTPSSFAIDMMNMGFNMISLATNHVMDGRLVIKNENDYYCDKNEEGIINNINFFKRFDKVYTSGIYDSNEDKDRIVIKKKNGISYTFLNYTYGTNMDGIIDYAPYLVNIYSNEKAKQDIEKVRDKVDVIFVAMHWGEENNPIPTEEQKKIASYLSKLGVNVIIGTHPHVVQPIEWIDNTLVIYSLGNLITAQSEEYDYSRLVGMMVDLKISKKGNKIIISNPRCELTYSYFNIVNNKKTNFEVIPYSYMKEGNSEYLRLYEKVSKIIRLYDKSIEINKLGTKSVETEIN